MKNYKEKIDNLFFLIFKIFFTFVVILVVVILGIYFVYDAYERKNISKRNDDPSSNLQILASWLALLASIVIVYIIIINYDNNNFNPADIEEPTL